MADSLCKKCGDRWYPRLVNAWENFFLKLIVRDKGVENVYALRKNLAYSLQYLEYLVKSFEELNLSGVLLNQTIKSFVITGMGVIEAILYYLIRINGLHRENHWELISTLKTGDKKVGTEQWKIENHVYRKLETPVEEAMSFKTMLNKAQKKQLLGKDSQIYKKLNHLRKLRNKVHLHAIDQAFDTDWNNFAPRGLNNMKEALYALLTSELFSPNERDLACLEFLQPQTEADNETETDEQSN